MHLLKIIKQNKFDLIFLFFLKLLSCIVIYFFLTNFLNESPLKYPDLSVYSLCGQVTSNALYSQLLCLLKLNHPSGMLNYNLIILSILINRLLSFLFRTQLTDLTSGFIVLNKKHIEKSVFENRTYGEYFIYLLGSLIKKNITKIIPIDTLMI